MSVRGSCDDITTSSPSNTNNEREWTLEDLLSKFEAVEWETCNLPKLNLETLDLDDSDLTQVSVTKSYVATLHDSSFSKCGHLTPQNTTVFFF